MGYLKTVGIALDQLGMALCNGNPDTTISGTIGYHNLFEPSWYWNTLKVIVNSTFYPVDGENHCTQAYNYDRGEKYRSGYKLPLVIITISFCIVIAIILWGIWLIDKFLYVVFKQEK